ncbi:TMV resistance protein N-like [Senna tora]|uniref:TMV resistance protein N-like n=1 Tax=Senna tora TaxID=362788 RepID=A0A835CMX7_9FABA|nr:TMV resistance protein N-like [Senna tora]
MSRGSSGGDLSLTWDRDKAVVVGKKTLIGRLFTDKNLNRGTFRNMIMKGWNLSKGVLISEMGSNIFLFTFDKEVDCVRILRDGPWAILGCLLNVKPWNPDVTVKEIDLVSCHFWVQFHGLPLEGFNDGNVIKLCQRVGSLVEYEVPVEDGKIARTFLRARVVVNLNEALLDGVWVPRPNNSRIWIQIKYERLQQFCFGCGVVGHDQKNCEKEKKLGYSTVEGGSSVGNVKARGKEVVVTTCVRAMDWEKDDNDGSIRSVTGVETRGGGYDSHSFERHKEGSDVAMVSKPGPSESVRQKIMGLSPAGIMDHLCSKSKDRVVLKRRRRTGVGPSGQGGMEASCDESEACLAIVPVSHIPYEQDLVTELRKVCLKRKRVEEVSPVKLKCSKVASISSPSDSKGFAIGSSPGKSPKLARSPRRRRIVTNLEFNFNDGLVDVPVTILNMAEPMEGFVFGQGDCRSSDGVGGWPEAATKSQ